MCGIALPSMRERCLSDKNGRDIFLIVLGVFQVCSAGFVFVYLVSLLFAVGAYRGIALALPVLLYDLWGVVSGLRLIFRRSIGACRAAAIWYLPIGVFFLAYGMHTTEHYPTGHSEYVFLGVAILSIFAVLVVPLLPDYYPGYKRTDGMIS
jgi:hypothetical protein